MTAFENAVLFERAMLEGCSDPIVEEGPTKKLGALEHDFPSDCRMLPIILVLSDL